MRRGLGIGAEHLGEHAHERRRRRFAGRLVQRRQRQRVPQHLAQPRRLPVPDEPVLDGLLRRARHPAGRCRGGAAARSVTGAPSRSTDRRSLHPSASHSMTPPSRCHGAGSGGHESTERTARRCRWTAPRATAARARATSRRCAAGRRTSRGSSPSGCADRCRPSRPSPGRRRTSRARRGAAAPRRPCTRAPRSASAVAAASPATPPPMTMTSRS